MVDVAPVIRTKRLNPVDASEQRDLATFLGTHGRTWTLLEGDVESVATRSDGSIVGASLLRRDTVASHHFAVEVWNAEVVTGLPDDPLSFDATTELWSALAVEPLAVSAEVVTTRLAADELAAVAAAQQCGWHVRDTLQTWRLSSDRSLPLGESGRFRDLTIRAVRREELGRRWLPEAARFGDAFAANYRLSRFHADPRFAPRAADFYRHWIEQAFLGEWADLILLSEGQSGPVAFISGRLSEAGGRVRLGSCLHASTTRGATSAVVDLTTVSAGFDECLYDVHSANGPVTGSTIRHGSPVLIRTSHALHRWQDPS